MGVPEQTHGTSGNPHLPSDLVDRARVMVHLKALSLAVEGITTAVTNKLRISEKMTMKAITS
jgi:hypothetical protein